MYCKSIPVELIKSTANLVEYISTYYPEIPIKRSGSVHMCCCPFHEENTGSMAVWDNNTYKCFGCQKHGDIISFVMDMENIGFKEACKVIANNVGIEYVLEEPNPVHEEYKDIMNEHNRRYWRNLKVSPIALTYLMEDRKLTEETIDNFRLGYVPMDEYKNRTDIGNIAGRIAFPILENKNSENIKCIGMGYRSLNDVKPKYINDKNIQDGPLSGVFIKSDNLYGYSHAYKAIKDKGYAIVTEGYMDVISMHQAKICNTVATMGTAFTEKQIDSIKNLTNNIILAYDGDSAGINNMIRVLPVLLNKNMNVKFLLLEDKMDLADLCVANDFNTLAIEKIIEDKSYDAIHYVIDKHTRVYEETVLYARKKVLSNISGILESINDNNIKDLYKSMVYKKIDI